MKHSSRINTKTLLIPGLALFLGYRIFSLIGLSSSSELQTVTELAAVMSENLTRSQTDSASVAEVQWPNRSLDDVLQHDPFAKPVPPVDSRQEIAESGDAEEMQPVRQVQLKAIYRTRTGTVALVGSEIVSEGQRMEDGSLVVAIRDDSVVLRPATAE